MPELCSPFKSYILSLSALVENQSVFLEELSQLLETETDAINSIDTESYLQLWTSVDKFLKFSSQNLCLAEKCEAKVRICMNLNQYVLGNEKVKDATGLAREQIENGESEIAECIIAGFLQLKQDLVAVKDSAGDADEFEQFAIGMALIKVNHLLTTDLEGLQPELKLQSFGDMRISSPNDSKLTSTRLKPLAHVQVQLRQFEELQKHIGDYVRTLKQLKSAVSDAGEGHAKVADCWWQVLGNHQYDYGVKCYVDKSSKWHGKFNFAGEKLEKSIDEWQQMQRAVGKLHRILAKEMDRQMSRQPNGDISRSVSLKKKLIENIQTELYVTPLLPAEGIAGVSRAIDLFRILLLRYVQMELQLCVSVLCLLLHELTQFKQKKFPFDEETRDKFGKYSDIVREFDALLDFTTRLMEALGPA